MTPDDDLPAPRHEELPPLKGASLPGPRPGQDGPALVGPSDPLPAPAPAPPPLAGGAVPPLELRAPAPESVPAEPYTPGSGQAEEVRKGGVPGALIALVGALLVALVVVAVVIATTSGSSSNRTASSDGSNVIVTTTLADTASNIDTVTTAVTTTLAEDPQRSSANQLETVLTDSQSTLYRLKDVIQAVDRCDLQPSAAADEIDQIASSRRAEISQIDQIDAGGDAASQDLVNKLRSALQASLASDQFYASELRSMATCGSVASAGSLDTAAGAAKQDFITAFNPVASRFGMRADWTKDNL